MTDTDTVEGTRALPGALAALAAAGVDITLGPPPHAGWVRLDVLAACDAFLDQGLRRASAEFGTDATALRLGATWLVGEAAAAVCWPAAVGLLGADAVVVEEPRHVHVPPLTGPRQFAVHVTGPVTEGATPTRVGAGVVAALAPVVEAVHLRTGRGRRALWGTVTDSLAAAFVGVGGLLGCQPRAAAIAEDVLAATDGLPGAAQWRELDGGTVHVRTVCCHWDRAEGGRLCGTCPRAHRD